MPSESTSKSVLGMMSPVPTFCGSLQVINNFALQHFKAARLFHKHVLQIETQNTGKKHGPFFEEIRSYSSACILSSAAALEALINELFITQGGNLRVKLEEEQEGFEQAFWSKNGIERKPILKKYQIALNTLNKSQFNESDLLYKNADALIKLRNLLVHYKPTWDYHQGLRADLESSLNDQFLPSPFVNGESDFVSMKCMTAGCTNWAINTVTNFVKEFDSRTSLDSEKLKHFID